MDLTETRRISRLTSILTQLQTKRLLTAPELASKYAVSIRTIYRDIRSLQEAGVPIRTEEGKGYSLMDHYRLAPIMFTENEANALIIAKQLVMKNKDASFIRDYSEAIDKIKSVLKTNMKDKANLLADRTSIVHSSQMEKTSNNLSTLQYAITNFLLADIEYTNNEDETTQRQIEPFALLSTDNWLLIAWCRLRKSFRYFRLDRIKKLEVLAESFTPHSMTLQDYFDKYH